MSDRRNASIDAEAVRRFHEDGVVFLPGLLDAQEIELAQAAFDFGMAHPGPGAGTAASANVNESAGEKFYTDVSNAESWTSPQFTRLLRDTPVADACAKVFAAPEVWFFGEQLFWKEGGEISRTAWHQDTSYSQFEGRDAAVAWICLDELPRESSLEFVRGSHKGRTYNGFRPGAADKTVPYYDDPNMPRLPDIEAHRADFDIVSWAVRPGDVILFHFSILHGGAPTRPGQRRRTISLRFFGPQAYRVQRPPLPKEAGSKLDFSYHFFKKVAALAVGEPVSRAEGAFRVRP